MQQPSPAMPVLLKQGYMERKTTFRGWKREYFRLLQDTIFSFKTHDSKFPLSEITLNDATVEDVSWDLKKANAIRIVSANGKKILLVCESPHEHKQWYDALFYSTKIMQRAEYCSPLSGGWLYVLEGRRFVSRWFVVKDSFLLCYNTREDMTRYGSGKMTKRKYVLPLMGAVLVYYKAEMPWSFAIQLYKSGEICSEHVFAAPSQAMMHVWMEVLYISMGNTPPEQKSRITTGNLFDTMGWGELSAVDTPCPAKTRQAAPLLKSRSLNPAASRRADEAVV